MCIGHTRIVGSSLAVKRDKDLLCMSRNPAYSINSILTDDRQFTVASAQLHVQILATRVKVSQNPM